MIRRCDDSDFDLIWAIINDGAQAYGSVAESVGRFCGQGAQS